MLNKFIIFFFIFFLSSFELKVKEDTKLGELVQSLLYEEVDIKNANMDITFDDLSQVERITVLSEYIENVKLVNVNIRSGTFKVKVLMNNGDSSLLDGKFSCYLIVPVTANKISAGSIIDISDITTVKIKVSQFRKDFFSTEEKIIGMQARKNLPSGVIFKKSDLFTPTAIKENDTVTMIYRSGDLELKSLGKSITRGAIGDTIKLKNDTSGVVIYGKVVDNSTVEIENK